MGLLAVSELAAAHRGTSEFALESFQQSTACLSMLKQVWPDPMLDWLSNELRSRDLAPALAVVLGVSSAIQPLPIRIALPSFLLSYLANLVSAGIRLIPLGQTDGQLAIAELGKAVLGVCSSLENATIEDLGSAALMVDLASMAHEMQYTRLFRS